MTTNKSSLCKTLILKRMGFTSALMCGMAAFAPVPAHAQTAPSQQLSDAMIQQQTPQAFPDQTQASTATTPSTPATPAVQTTPATPKTGQAVQQTAAPAQTVQETPAGTQTTVPATTPPASAVPAQPEAQKLVPATAMGTDAKNVVNGQGGDTQPTASADQQQEALPNPVEEAAGNESPSGQEDSPPNLPDALEKYTAKNNEVAADQGSPENQSGDALPQVNKLNMVRLEGSGFENSAGQRSTVAVDGSLDQSANQKLQDEIRSEAFDAAITGMFPLSPEQIEGLLKRYDTSQKVVNTPPYDAPKPEISVQNISLDPGMTPPTIKTAVGNVTTLNILDATGAPWPVQDVTWAGDYEIVEPEEGGHIIRITPMSQFAHGNIVIRLLTLKTPLTMTLETSRDIVQYRVDARIPEYGPFANAPLMQGAKSSLVAGSPDLTSLLDGVMPGGMVKLEVSGVDGRTTAYAMNGTTYVRTPLTLLSPAWQSSVSSADGMNVYALTNAPVLLLSDGGEFMRATLKEKEDLLDE